MNSRLMLRLIDVAMNILFAFIAISRLKTEYVELPATGISQQQAQTPHETFLHLYNNIYKFEDMGRRWQCGSLTELENNLISLNNRYLRQGVKLIVTIQPHRPGIMQTLVDVFDICQRNKIEKNLNYESNN